MVLYHFNNNYGGRPGWEGVGGGRDTANIHEQFSDLAEGANLLKMCVFRMCSPGMQLWTHYDVSLISLYLFSLFFFFYITLITIKGGVVGEET